MIFCSTCFVALYISFSYLEHFFHWAIYRLNWNKQNNEHICLSSGQLLKGMKSMSQLNFEDNLLTKVAWYYYKDQLTQQEIASLLHISRNKVVRLLDKARTEGVVTFHVKGTGLHCLSIERDLMKNSI